MPDVLPGIDIQSALKRLGGNRALLAKLIVSFGSDYADSIEVIREALGTGDRERVVRTVHTLKGASGNLSAHNLFAAAMALEGALGDEGNEAIEPGLDRLDTALRQVIDSARRLEQPGLAPVPGGQEAVAEACDVDLSKAKPLFVRLAELLRENDFEAEEALADLVRLLHGTGHHDQVLELEDRISKFAFGEALEILSALAAKIGLELGEGR